MNPTNLLKAAKSIVRYRLEVFYKEIREQLRPPATNHPPLRATPSVTLLITNINNRLLLELTLRSLVQKTKYPNYHIVVADNGSTDGSIELVRGLIQDGWPIRLIEHGQPRPQHEWYDHMARTATTPYWVGLHEDMMFIGTDWLIDLIRYMETHPDVYLLGGEYFPPRPGYVEPVSQETVDLQESLSTWIFCARTALRTHVDTSFAFYKYWDEDRNRTVCYDQGGKLMADLRARGLSVAHMPAAYGLKYHHIANISWAFKLHMREDVRRFKKYQLADVKRRVLMHQTSAVRPPAELFASNGVQAVS